jgi:hypothetical protein
MLTFDTIKIAFPKEYLQGVQYNELQQAVDSKERLVFYSRKNIIPGLIRVRIGATEVAIEISAKILKADYPKLISSNTIEAALQFADTALPFTFDVHEVLSVAHVLKAHQTQDLALLQSFAAYASPLGQLFVSRNYDIKQYKNETITFIQIVNALDDKHREYFKIYDKEKEYKRATDANTAYRETLTKLEKESVATYFAGKVRFETELNTKRKLRQYFPDIHKNILLRDMLQSASNPLVTQFNEITKHIYMILNNQTKIKSFSFADALGYDKTILFYSLEKHDFDLSKIDSWLKEKKVTKPTQTRRRKDYAELLAQYKAHHTDNSSIAPLYEMKGAVSNPTPITIGTMGSNLEPATEQLKENQEATNEAAITIDTIGSKMELKEASEAVRAQDEKHFKELAEYEPIDLDSWLPY